MEPKMLSGGQYKGQEKKINTPESKDFKTARDKERIWEKERNSYLVNGWIWTKMYQMGKF